MKITRGERIIILSIIAAASILRLWNLFEIPFTYDEFSALFRTQYNSFGEMIALGARVDGHPVGVQVFLYYYTQLVGFNEGWIKLPFIIAGIASVYLIWRIGREWFSPQVGLLSAATIAFMHYTIVYSQIARPYGSGLFFTLLMLLGWSRIVLTKTGVSWKNYLYFILGAALCMYNHHFSALMVGLTGFAGLFLIRGKALRNYVFSGLIIGILYIPHIEIFFHQLNIGGIGGWLNKPTPSFFYDYLKYIFHFSKITAITFGAIVLFGLGQALIAKNYNLKKAHLLAFVLGVMPAVIGYLYSVEVAPLLQFSVLIFSFPMLVILAFSVFEKAGKGQTYILTGVWSLMLVFSLIFVRQHYRYFYKYPYQESMKEIKSFTESHAIDSTLVLCNFRPEITTYYAEKYSVPNNLKIINPDSIKELKHLHLQLSNQQYEYLIFAKTNENQPWLYAMIREYFPGIILENNYNQGSCVFMKRKESAGYSNYSLIKRCNFLPEDNGTWRFDNNHVLIDTLDYEATIEIDSSVEYESTLVQPLLGHLNSKNSVIDATIWVFIPDSIVGEALWVASVESDTGAVVWYASPINSSSVPVNKWVPVSVSIFVPDMTVIPTDKTLRVYLFNSAKSTFYIKRAFVGIRSGNPAIYWITYGLF
ncbi:MAG: hypothetical protein CVU11_11125 [Bacteroidetes bacterium HGW-Bacteroidetes-6]|jgi:4-amino-4-deoxy-L-arabinose transferase-like glycosyltransferase|nr:MAG: hypothetical protein CVU11_11125 [Bacteroidetes bacterium HGW-Bacteroidetes-6]